MPEFIVVGCGLGGVAITETLRSRGHSFVVYDEGSGSASMVAGGLYNPVVLKRINLAWEGTRLMRTAIPFYQQLEKDLGVTIDEKLPVMRLFHGSGEHNAWAEAADRPGLSEFLDPAVTPNENAAIEAPFGLGRVRHTGRIHTARMLMAYRKYLKKMGVLREEPFVHKAMGMGAEGVSYQGIEARAVIFSEGFGLKKNPFFNYLPLNGTKGELLVIHAPDLKESRVIKSGVFIIPLGADRYLVGATYARDDHSPEPTQQARDWLLGQLRKFLRCTFEVEDQWAGIRPTVPDRRPIVGGHPAFPRLFVLNGLGSRGVLIAPYAAGCLYRLLVEGEGLPEAMDSMRFAGRYEKSRKRT
jgi:glycine/D-amino acid oxidase-like deaminating enzyme